MARGELMKKLLASYGRDEEFRAVAEQIILEEEAKNNRVLARSLRKTLDNTPQPALQGMASKGLGGLLVLGALAAVWHLAGLLGWPRRWLAWPIGYGMWSALQTVLCSVAWLIEPWQAVEGRGICEARTDLDLAALALLIAAAWAVFASPVRSYTDPTR